jgi:hypothetical protein
VLRQKVEQIARKLTFLQQNREFSYFSWSEAGFGAESESEPSGSDIFLVGAESERSGLEMRGAGAEREREKVGAAHL